MINGFSDFQPSLFSGNDWAVQPSLPIHSLPPQYTQVIQASLANTAQSPTLAHSTTIVATVFKDGVAIVADRQATAGYQVAKRNAEKLRLVDNHAIVGMAGTSAMAATLARLLQMEVEYNEKVEHSSLTFEGKANLLSQMIASNYLRIPQTHLIAIPLLVGYDLDNHVGKIVNIDVAGSMDFESRYGSIGSGSTFAAEHCKAHWQHNMTKNQAISLLLGAIISASDEDTATSGPDFVRNIFPRLMIVTQEGVSAVPDSTIASVCTTILAKNGKRLGEQL